MRRYVVEEREGEEALAKVVREEMIAKLFSEWVAGENAAISASARAEADDSVDWTGDSQYVEDKENDAYDDAYLAEREHGASESVANEIGNKAAGVARAAALAKVEADKRKPLLRRDLLVEMIAGLGGRIMGPYEHGLHLIAQEKAKRRKLKRLTARLI